jgi:hypothetical protein
MSVFKFFRQILRSAIARSYGKSMFNFARNYQTVLQNGCAILHSHRLLFHILAALVVSEVCELSIPIGGISLITYNVEQLFMCLFFSCVWAPFCAMRLSDHHCTSTPCSESCYVYKVSIWESLSPHLAPKDGPNYS